jgi:hypothetical protein
LHCWTPVNSSTPMGIPYFNSEDSLQCRTVDTQWVYHRVPIHWQHCWYQSHMHLHCMVTIPHFLCYWGLNPGPHSC